MLGHGEDARPKLSFPLDELSPEPSSELVARAAARERGEALAEARRRERRVERLPHVRDLAPAQRALAVEERVALGVEALAHERELPLARLELRLEHGEARPRRSRRSGAAGRRRRRLRLAGSGAAAVARSAAACVSTACARASSALCSASSSIRRAASSFSIRRASCSRSSSRARSAAASCRSDSDWPRSACAAGERRLELPLSLGETRCARLELGLARLQLLLPGLERLRPLECSSLAGDERIAGGGRLALLLGGLAGVEAALQLHELALARRHRLRPLAERLLQLLELGVCLLVVRMPLVGELTRQAEERRLVGVDAGVVGDAAAAAARRPAVEALFPAVYACSLCQQTLSM